MLGCSCFIALSISFLGSSLFVMTAVLVSKCPLTFFAMVLVTRVAPIKVGVSKKRMRFINSISVYSEMGRPAVLNLLSYERPAGSQPLCLGHQAVRKTFLPHHGSGCAYSWSVNKIN